MAESTIAKEYLRPKAETPAATTTGPAQEVVPADKRAGVVRDFLQRRGLTPPTSRIEPVPQTHEPVVLNRGELLHGATTESGREVTIPSETVEKYSNFLDTYVRNLGKLAELPPPTLTPPTTARTMLEFVTQDPNRQYDKLLLDLLGTQTKDADERIITSSVDTAKVKAFLQKEDNWAATTLLMEQYALMTDLGLGMNETVQSDIKKREGEQDITKDHKDVTQRLWTARHIAKTGTIGLGKGLAAAAYALGGQGTIKRVYESDTKLLASVVAGMSAADKEYMKAMVGIDVSKIVFPPGSSDVTFKDGYKPDVSRMRKNNTDLAAARESFLVSIGVDVRSISSADEHIFGTRNMFGRRKDSEGEPLTTRYQMKVADEYDKLPVGANGVFEKGRRKVQARSTVLTGYLERQVAFEKAGQGENTNAIQALAEKKKIMQERPDVYRAEARKEAEDAKRKAEESREEVKKKRTDIVDPLPAKDRAVTDFEDSLAREFSVPPDADLGEALATAKSAVEAKLSAAKTAYATLESKRAADYKKFREGLTTSRDKLMAAAAAALPTAAKGTTIAEPKFEAETALFQQEMTAKYDGNLAQYKTERDNLAAQVKELESKAQRYEAAKIDRLSATLSIVGQERDQLLQGSEAYENFTDPAATIASDPDLESLSVTELALLLSGGAVPSEFEIKHAIFAKAEQAARQIETRNPIPAYQTKDLSRITASTAAIPPGAGIAIDDLFRDERSLQAEVMANIPIMSSEGARRMVRNARAAAESQLRTRYTQRLEIEEKHYDEVIKAEEKKLEGLSDFKEPVADIELAMLLMVNQGDIYSRAHGIQGDPAELAKLTDPVLVLPDNVALSPAERNSGLPMWYINTFHFLIPQAARALNREDIFKIFLRTFPPATASTIWGSSSPIIQEHMKQAINYARDRALAL